MKLNFIKLVAHYFMKISLYVFKNKLPQRSKQCDSPKQKSLTAYEMDELVPST